MRKIIFIAFLVLLYGGHNENVSYGGTRDAGRYLMEAREHFLLEEYDLAEEKCARVIEMAPGAFPAYMLMGAIRGSRSGREEEALAFYERALSIDPNHPGIYGEMASLYARIGMEEDAIKTLERGLDLFPRDYGINYTLGFLYLRARNAPVEAAASFERSLNVRPGNPELIYLTGFSHIMAGNDPAALEYITLLRQENREVMAVRLESAIRDRDAGIGSGEAFSNYVGSGPERSGEDGQGVGIVRGTGTITVRHSSSSR